MINKKSIHWYFILLLPLAGCGSSLPLLTELLRRTLAEKGLEEVRYYAASEISFRSIRELDTTSETGPFKPDLHRVLQVSNDTPGRFLSAGDGWIAVDFGSDIVLTFTRSPVDGIYSMRGWGTVTIQGERYDIMVGVLSGGEVRLQYDPRGRL